MIDVTKTCENHQKEDTEMTQLIQTNRNSFVLALGEMGFFLHCSQYKTVVWICAGNGVDISEIYPGIPSRLLGGLGILGRLSLPSPNMAQIPIR